MSKNDYSPVKIDRTKETFNEYIDAKTDYIGPVYLDLGHKQLEFKNVQEFFSSYGKRYSIDGELTNNTNNNKIDEDSDTHVNKEKRVKRKRIKNMVEDSDFATVDSTRDEEIEQLKRQIAALQRKRKLNSEISTFDDYADLDARPPQRQRQEKLMKNNLKISFKIGDSKWKLDSRFGFLINDSNSRLFVLGYDSTDNSDRISFDEETPDIRIIGDFGEVITTYIGSFTAGDISYLVFLKNK
jgi:hypothetical protein